MSSQASDIETAIARGLAYIASQQQPNGGFVSYSSPKIDDFNDARQHRTIYFPSLIGLALEPVRDAVAEPIRRNIGSFLQQQKSLQWSFNYWDRHEHTSQPYPDDLDDTFLALAALWHIAPASFTGEVLAVIAKLLIVAEQTVGGPYRTWLTKSQLAIWQDTDLAVNANINNFLALQGVELPNVTEMMEKAIQNRALVSPYYPNNYPIVYFIARWYKGPHKWELLRQVSIDFDNPTHTALTVASWLRHGHSSSEVGAAIQYLLDSQRADGSWPVSGFCIDPSYQGKKYFAGTPALSTALCLETLALYMRPRQHAPKTNLRYRAVLDYIDADIAAISHGELREQTKKIAHRIRVQDVDGQIILLPWLVRKAVGVRVPEEQLQRLAASSVWGWMAYTSYDDFFDGEGRIAKLPSANFALRRLVVQAMNALPDVFEFEQDIMAILDQTDAANAWEVANCRARVEAGKLYYDALPDYADFWSLAARSFGHAASGLGVLYAAGLGRHAPQMRALRSFFWHYLIARQLNDDAHDWQEDIARGHLNSVVVMLLRDAASGFSITNLSPLQARFWDETIDSVASLIHYHVAKARSAIAEVPGIDAKILDSLVEPLVNAADEAIQKRDQVRRFIASF